MYMYVCVLLTLLPYLVSIPGASTRTNVHPETVISLLLKDARWLREMTTDSIVVSLKMVHVAL